MHIKKIYEATSEHLTFNGDQEIDNFSATFFSLIMLGDIFETLSSNVEQGREAIIPLARLNPAWSTFDSMTQIIVI